MDVTIDKILETMSGYVKSHTPISPTLWLDASLKLVTLIADEYEKLYELESQVAQAEALLAMDGTSTAAKTKVKAMGIWKEWRIQDARIRQILEMGRIAKKYADITKTEMYGQQR